MSDAYQWQERARSLRLDGPVWPVSVMNRGGTPTSMGNISAFIKNWEVMESESLNDHNCIIIHFDLKDTRNLQIRRRTTRGWNTKKLDTASLSSHRRNGTTSAEGLRDTSKFICDKNRRPREGSRWNEEISKHQRTCIIKYKNIHPNCQEKYCSKQSHIMGRIYPN